MFLKIFALNIILVFNISAQTIQVASHRTNYILEINKSGNLSIRGYQVNMKMSKHSCNEQIIKEFIAKTKLLIKTKPMSKTREKGLFKVIIDGKEYYESPKSKVGYNLISIPKEFQRMKIQEKMLCSKK